MRGINYPEIHHDLDAPISPITNRLTDQIPPLSIHAAEISGTARPVTKSRPYSVTRSREDPSLHNAKPRELDALFLQHPSDATTDNVGAPIDEMALLSNRIFSDVSFSSLKLGVQQLRHLPCSYYRWMDSLSSFTSSCSLHTIHRSICSLQPS